MSNKARRTMRGVGVPLRRFSAENLKKYRQREEVEKFMRRMRKRRGK